MTGLGAFEYVPDDCSAPNTECPSCKQKGKVEVEYRDPVWEETGYRCCGCGHRWVRG